MRYGVQCSVPTLSVCLFVPLQEDSNAGAGGEEGSDDVPGGQEKSGVPVEKGLEVRNENDDFLTTSIWS